MPRSSGPPCCPSDGGRLTGSASRPAGYGGGPWRSGDSLPPGTTLSEAASKQLLAPFGLTTSPTSGSSPTPSRPATRPTRSGIPVVAKLGGDAIAHKTERGLVRLRLGDRAAVEAAAGELLAAAQPDDGEVGVLVAPMVAGNRELIAGLVRDPQFGPTVMLGRRRDPRRGGRRRRVPTGAARRRDGRGDDRLPGDPEAARRVPWRSRPSSRPHLVELLVGLGRLADRTTRRGERRHQPVDRRPRRACRWRSTRSSSSAISQR